MDNYEIWYNMKNNSLTFPDFSTKIFTFPDFPWLSLTFPDFPWLPWKWYYSPWLSSLYQPCNSPYCDYVHHLHKSRPVFINNKKKLKNDRTGSHAQNIQRVWFIAQVPFFSRHGLHYILRVYDDQQINWCIY